MDARQQVGRQNPTYQIGIHYESEFGDDSDISVNGNEYLLKVTFVNLFENGCKFSANKCSDVTISIKNDKVILHFKDNGIGIEEEDLPNIFTSFFRGKNKKYADGHGIGLSLTKKIINLHNGKIMVQSAPQKGSIFQVEIPHI